MTMQMNRAGTTTRSQTRRRRCVIATAVTLVLATAAATVGTVAAEPTDDPLSTTLLSRLELGGEPRLAVRWDGPPGALLDVCVDLDGDGVPEPDEVVVEGRPLKPGIEVVGLEIPPGMHGVREESVWVAWREAGAGEVDHPVQNSPLARTHNGCAWQPGFTYPRLDGTVYALTVFDDGTGPALYAGGRFKTADTAVANRIAKWDGTSWSALSGPAGTGVDLWVFSLAVFDDGAGPALFAGGWFEEAGGVTVNHVAKWDGFRWSALSGPSGTGTSGTVYALAAFDDGSGPALYAGGAFDTAGGVATNHIARWDGSSWSALSGPSGTGVSGTVFALAVFDDGSGPELFAGGGIASAGGVEADYVARWDGTTWSALQGQNILGTDGPVYALAVYDDGSGPALYVGGNFMFAGEPVIASSIARWDGSAWSTLVDPTGIVWRNEVLALTVFDDGSGPALYAGGELEFGRWDGREWSSLPRPSGADIHALAGFNYESKRLLFVGGSFDISGDGIYDNLATWDGSTWSTLPLIPGDGINGGVRTLTVFDDGSGAALYAGGFFTAAGAVVAHHVAKWNGTAWSALSEPSEAGLNDRVNALAVFDDGSGRALFAGGRFTTADAATVNSIAKWNGSTWTDLSGPSGTGISRHDYDSAEIFALTVFDDGSGSALYVGGEFSRAGGIPVNSIARWDGTTWSDLSGPPDTGTSWEISTLAVFDDGSGPALFAGGRLPTADGQTVEYVAKWDGVTWSRLTDPSGSLIDGDFASVSALAVFDDGSGPALYAGGRFASAGGIPLNCIAKWDGIAWSALSGPTGSGTSLYGDVLALTVHDDGSGPALFAGGGFETAGGVPANHIAKWDGTAWSALSAPLGFGTNFTVSALEGVRDSSGPALFVGGTFTAAGGLASSAIAAWRCEQVPSTHPPRRPRGRVGN